MPSLQTTYKHRYPLPPKEARFKPESPMVNKAHQLIILPEVSINYLMYHLYSWARIMDEKSCHMKDRKIKGKKAEGTTYNQISIIRWLHVPLRKAGSAEKLEVLAGLPTLSHLPEAQGRDKLYNPSKL